ncbi:MAG: hypothetical protein NXI00_02860 [Cytophagales bacterium]|nr:hypothetical protein [Cytophagales bacterium]
MNNILFWRNCYELELVAIEGIIQELKANKLKYSNNREYQLNPNLMRKINSIDKYLTAITGFIKVIQRYKESIDNYHLDYLKSYQELTEEIAHLNLRCNYLSKIILNKNEESTSEY